MRKKGFTLIELIIVIAIIGVLAGVLIPSWGHYMRRARTRSQNLQAKAIFSAAQTAVTDMKFAERNDYNSFMDTCVPPVNQSEVQSASDKLYGNFPSTDSGLIDTSAADFTSEFCFYWNGSAMVRLDVNADDQTPWKKRIIGEWNEKLADSINHIVDSDSIVYKVYVKDYKVVSVVSARSDNDRYLGTYPLTLDVLEEKGVDVDDIRENKILATDMHTFALDSMPSDDEDE